MHNATSKRAVSLAPASGRAVSLVHLCNKFMARTDKVHSPNAATKQEATAALSIGKEQHSTQQTRRLGAAKRYKSVAKALQPRTRTSLTYHHT